jgi:hypothetical protein
VAARVFVQDGKLNLIVQDARLDFKYRYLMTNQMPVVQYGSRAKPGAVVLKAAGAELPRPDWVVLPLATTSAAQPEPAAATPALSVEDRLTGLKRFREQNLITEEEYTRKKAEILKDY